jgi:hypothetical protein
LEKKNSYINFNEIIHFIENEIELEFVILSLKYKGILFLKEGIVRMLINWESNYKSLFKDFIKTNRILLNEDCFDLTDDQINSSRKALREKDYYKYIKLASEHYFIRLNKIVNYSDELRLTQPVGFIELKESTLNHLEVALYY